MIIGFLLLVALQIIGQTIISWLDVPVPGALLGLALMLLGLIIWGKISKGLTKVSNILLSHLMLMFIPSIVAIMTQAPTIAKSWMPYILSCVLATGITAVVTAFTFQYMLKRQNKTNN